jgi:HK97 gp10 family phage protein
MAELIECEVKGLEEIQQALESVPRAIARGLLRKAMARAANLWREEMAQRAPRLLTVKLAGNPKQVRLPGDLARHIGIKVVVNSDLEGSVQVGPSKRVFWSKFLEFGTYKMRAQPFINLWKRVRQLSRALDCGRFPTIRTLRAIPLWRERLTRR